MREHGVEVINLDLTECVEIMKRFIVEEPTLWNEDIGK
jgi:cytosine deaminase